MYFNYKILCITLNCFVLGLLYLLLSEIDEAEQYLQMAARWSQTSKDSMIALNNLGVMCWFQLGLSLTQNQGNIEEKCFLTRDLLHFCSSIRKSVNDNDEMKNDFQKSIKLTEEQHILLQVSNKSKILYIVPYEQFNVPNLKPYDLWSKK